MSNTTMMLSIAILALAISTAWAQDCSGFDPSCPNLIFAANVTTPTCPSGSSWDQETMACWKPCSLHNTNTTQYQPHEDDPSICAPVCPAGMTARPGIDGYSTTCLVCPASAPVEPGKIVPWVCRRGGQITSPLRSVTISWKAREGVEGGCSAGSLFVNGVCASCTSCDTYLTADPDSNTPRQYLFWQAEGATFCVPDTCCFKESWLVEGCEGQDCDGVDTEPGRR